MTSVPATQVSEVDFLIDDLPAWVARVPPYVFGQPGNMLVTSFLTPGKHSFTVGVTTLSYQETWSTVIAMVAAPPAPPDGLAGTWTRTVSAADVQKATSDPVPLGDWHVTIDPVGWRLRDPQGSQRRFDVGYQSSATLVMRPTIEYPDSNIGGFCAYADPTFIWTVVIGSGGKTLTLHPAGHDPCRNRVAILDGIWMLVSK